MFRAILSFSGLSAHGGLDPGIHFNQRIKAMDYPIKSGNDMVFNVI